MKKIKFLPPSFWYMGIAIVCIGIAWNVFRVLHYRLINDPYTWLGSSGITIGLLAVMFTREKMEDEFIDQLRLRAFLLSIIFTCIYFVGFNIMAFLLNFKTPVPANTAISFLQAFYICYFFWLKKKYQFTSKENNS